MSKNKLAFIGGSGLYNIDLLKDVVEHDLEYIKLQTEPF